jgi:hypothetical protein
MSDGGTPVLWSEIKSLRAEIEAVRKGDMKALELQAKEYERRLDELNHSHTLAAARYAQFVSRELHDREFSRVDRDINSLARVVWIGVGIALLGEGLLWLTVNHLLRAP